MPPVSCLGHISRAGDMPHSGSARGVDIHWMIKIRQSPAPVQGCSLVASRPRRHCGGARFGRGHVSRALAALMVFTGTVHFVRTSRRAKR